MDFFWQAPPVTRTLTALTLVQSALVHGGLMSGYHVIYLPSLIFKWRPEIWRLATPFLLTGPGLSFVFDLYFMYHYGSSLETGSARFDRPGEFFIYLLFVAFTLMLTAGAYFGAVVLTSPLIMAFVYTYSQDNRGKRVRFYFIDIPVVFLPYALLLVSMVMLGWESALIESMGIISAHLYDFITRIYPTFGGGRNFIVVPAFVERFFTRHTVNVGYRGYGTASRPARVADQPESGPLPSSWGWTSGVQGSWSGRGAGRRLG